MLSFRAPSQTQKGIFPSRSFGHAITSQAELSDAVCHFAACATEKLRRQGSVAASMHMFISTNAFDTEAEQYTRGAAKTLLFPTDFTPDLIANAQSLLEEIYRPGLAYKRAGVYLDDIVRTMCSNLTSLPSMRWGEKSKRRR